MVKNKRIVFMGTKEIGYECLKILINKIEKTDNKIVAVLTKENKNMDTENTVTKLSNENGLRIVKNLDEYMKIEDIDILISVQYHQILKKHHIEKAKEIAINLHMAPLPEYRGCNQFSFAIINDDREFGTTIHRLEEGIDSGDIIFERRFEIPKNSDVKSLYDKTYTESIKLFSESIEKILNKEYKMISQKDFLLKRKTSIHFRKEINEIKKISLNWEKEKIEKHILGTYMPGFEPPFIEINGKKYYFVKENDYKK